jgi:hypothetical protein
MINNRFLIAAAIQKLCPDAQYTYDNEDLDTLKFIAGTKPPTANQIKAILPTIEAELLQKAEATATEKQALLDRLGISAEEAALLLQ